MKATVSFEDALRIKTTYAPCVCESPCLEPPYFHNTIQASDRVRVYPRGDSQIFEATIESVRTTLTDTMILFRFGGYLTVQEIERIEVLCPKCGLISKDIHHEDQT